MAFNSTIRSKTGPCPMCPNDQDVPLIGGLCNNHYWQNVRMKSAAKNAGKQRDEEAFPELIAELDKLVSRYVRLSRSDKNGICRCFTCGVKGTWQEMDCGHFIKRGNMYLRHDLRNLRPQCHNCNRRKDGNIIAFARNLNEEKPGIVEILIEEGNLVYKYSREELKGLILDFQYKLKKLA